MLVETGSLIELLVGNRAKDHEVETVCVEAAC